MSERTPRNHPALIALAVFLGAAIAGLFLFLVVYYQELGPAISVGLFVAVLVLGRLLSTYVQWLRALPAQGGGDPPASMDDEDSPAPDAEPQPFQGEELSEAELSDEDKQ